MEITGTNLLVSTHLCAGHTLPDADMLMKVKMAPINLLLTSKMFIRKVEGKNTITTPAGTFDFFVIPFEQESKM